MDPIWLLSPLPFVALFWAFTRWGRIWGATRDERELELAGDALLPPPAPSGRKVVFTRAITIDAPPTDVWPWLAQVCRGAGIYSYDRLDNGGKASARHIVSWIPEPRGGDASAIGYLRHIDVGRELVWWIPGDKFFGSKVRLVTDMYVVPREGGSRLVIRMSADAEGGSPFLVLEVIFAFIDSIMARRQLQNLKAIIERHSPDAEPADPESGQRDQYQLYEVVFASGEGAGVPGKEKASKWRKAAIDARVLS